MYELDYTVYKFLFVRFSDNIWMIISLAGFVSEQCTVAPLYFSRMETAIFKLVMAMKKSKRRPWPCIWDENFSIVVSLASSCYFHSCFNSSRYSFQTRFLLDYIGSRAYVDLLLEPLWTEIYETEECDYIISLRYWIIKDIVKKKGLGVPKRRNVSLF